MKIYFVILILCYLAVISNQQNAPGQRNNQRVSNSQPRYNPSSNQQPPTTPVRNPRPQANYPPATSQNRHPERREETNQITQNIPKYICSLQYNDNEKCSCIIISPTTVVTAGHCVYEINANYYQVGVGLNFETKHNIINTDYKHFQYQYPYFDDIVELTLETPIQITSDIEVVQIPTEEECANFPFGSDASIWGPSDKKSPLILNEIHVKVLNVTEMGCQNYYLNKRITQNMFCAGWNDGRIDPCKAEDGSPLIIKNKLYGVASWGMGCKRPTRGSVYANYCKFAYNYRNKQQEEYVDYQNTFDIYDDNFEM